MAQSPFLTDIKTLCERARQHTEDSSVVIRDPLDSHTAVRLLNEALATEVVCVLRYKHHYFLSLGMNADAVANEFLRYIHEEQSHADRIARRIVQLKGEPNFSPEGMLSRSHTEYVEGDSLIAMVREDLVAELVAIECYRELIDGFGSEDPTSRRMLEEILSAEEEHVKDMAALLENLARRT